jgi:hypothetical protein
LAEFKGDVLDFGEMEGVMGMGDGKNYTFDGRRAGARLNKVLWELGKRGYYTTVDPTNGAIEVRNARGNLAARLFPTLRTWRSGAEPGVDPSPISDKIGTTRMEDHPEFAAKVAELQAKGFEIRYAGEHPRHRDDVDPHAGWDEIEMPGGKITIERYVVVIRGMRYLDLLHEAGHVDQMLVNFAGKPPITGRYSERGGYRAKLGEQKAASRGAYFGSKYEMATTELHNRLVEWIRMRKIMESDPATYNEQLLIDHAAGIKQYRGKMMENLNRRSPAQEKWTKDKFPDLEQLKQEYRDLGGLDLEKMRP